VPGDGGDAIGYVGDAADGLSDATGDVSDATGDVGDATNNPSDGRCRRPVVGGLGPTDTSAGRPTARIDGP